MACNTPAGPALLPQPDLNFDPHPPGLCEDRPDYYRSLQPIEAFGGVAFTLTVSPGGSVSDYDQGTSGLDSIFFPPITRINQHPLSSGLGNPIWFDALPMHFYGTLHPDAQVDSVNTSIDGTGLTPASHDWWDGTLAPALSNPVNEYLNLGGKLTWTTADPLGLNDCAGMHFHLNSSFSSSTADNAQHWDQKLIFNMASITTKNIATSLTTMTNGVPVNCPSLTAPSQNCLMFWIVHVAPELSGSGVMDHVNDPAWWYTPSWWNFSTYSIPTTGGVGFFTWRPWEAGTYTPQIQITSGGDREVAISGLLCEFRRDGGDNF